MTRVEMVAAVVLILVALGGSIWYLAAKKKKKAARTAALPKEDRELLAEDPLCDPIRAELARLRAEGSLVYGDPLREGNIRGAIAQGAAQLVECERAGRRARLA